MSYDHFADVFPVVISFVDGEQPSSKKLSGRRKDRVKSVYVYTEKMIDQHRDHLKENQKMKEEYEEKRSEYRSARNEAESIRSEVWDAYREAHESRQKKVSLLDTYRQYVDIAEGNEEIAMEFLEKAYTITDTQKSFIVNEWNLERVEAAQ